MNRGFKPPENEVFKTKQDELDAYLASIAAKKKMIRKLRDELEQDENFERMIQSENVAKEQYRKLQQLLDDNVQLKKIHGGQEAALDSSAEQRVKREEIRALKEKLQHDQQKLKGVQHKQRERDKKIKDKHEQLIEIQERTRNMNEVLRLKKIEEKREIDRQVEAGVLTVGSPDRRERSLNRESEVRALSVASGSFYNVSIRKFSSPKHFDSVLSEIVGEGGAGALGDLTANVKLKQEDIEKLEKKCQRMIFEKEDKYLDTEQKLKAEDAELE